MEGKRNPLVNIGLGLPPSGLSVREEGGPKVNKRAAANSSSLVDMDLVMGGGGQTGQTGQSVGAGEGGSRADNVDNLCLGEEASAPAAAGSFQQLPPERSATVASMQSDGGSSASTGGIPKSNVIGV